MQIAMVGLGRMGMNMAKRLIRGGPRGGVYNRTAQKALDLAAEETGVTPVESLAQLKGALQAPRLVWLMLPAGAVDAHLDELAEILEPGDLVVEGGNSLYKDDLRRAPLMRDKASPMWTPGSAAGCGA